MVFLRRKRKICAFIIVILVVLTLTYIQTALVLPSQIVLLEGEEYIYNFRSPFLVNVKIDNNEVVEVSNSGKPIKNNYIRLSNPVLFKPRKNGSVTVDMSLFGLIPIKGIQVDVVPNKEVIVGGNTVGVKLEIEGVLVVGLSDVESKYGKKVYPGREAGLKAGDVLIGIDGKELTSIDQLISEINKSNGQKIDITYKRGEFKKHTSINPIKSIDTNRYHIGLWVRDSMGGIGTLTFYDPDTSRFGALGHGISDIDTEKIIPIGDGAILESNVVSIIKGKQGKPGELRGIFSQYSGQIGTIEKNTKYGIYGKLDKEYAQDMMGERYQLGLRNQVQEGEAKILANVNGKEVKEYSIEIEKVTRQAFTGAKGMIIRVTDEKLLELTGGIVQGMSGSPIIQNNKIIGAVTHVLVNDPTKGYGIFIERMVNNMAS